MRRNLLVALMLALMSAKAICAEAPPCDGKRLATAKKAMGDAKRAMIQSLEAIRNSDPKVMSKMTTWLGIKSSSETNAIIDKINRMVAFTDGATFRCAVLSLKSQKGDYYAYVYADKIFVITLGEDFFRSPSSGFSSQLGTLVHEMSHFLISGATADPKIYGTQEALKLAKDSPASAQRNAENIEYFIESYVFDL